MNVAFFGQSGPYAPMALRALLAARLACDLRVVVEGHKFAWGRRRHRWCLPDGQPLPPPNDESLTNLAQAAGIDVLQTADVNHPSVARMLMHRGVDAVVCVGFDRLFGPAVLQCGRLLCVNAHPSRLPALRGPAPLFWSLRQAATHTAVTLHSLDPQEDHGPILAQSDVAIPPRIGGDALYRLVGKLAGSMLCRLLDKAMSGALCGVPQDHARASRAPRPRAEDAYVEPMLWGCRHLVNFACGAAYFRAAWMRFGDATFHLKSGLRADPGRRMPAQYALRGDYLVVACRDGLAHLRVQT